MELIIIGKYLGITRFFCFGIEYYGRYFLNVWLENSRLEIYSEGLMQQTFINFIWYDLSDQPSGLSYIGQHDYIPALVVTFLWIGVGKSYYLSHCLR